MTRKGQTEKWTRAVLGFVCVVLTIYLVLQLGGTRVGASRGLAAAGKRSRAHPARSASGGAEELARYDPQVRLDLLKQFQSRPLPDLRRSPFEIDAPKRAVAHVTAPPGPALPPPPPPPIPLKTVGYSEKNGRHEAFVTDDDQTYVVHEGETFAQRYRVLKITPQFIEIEDASSHQTVQLPFAQ